MKSVSLTEIELIFQTLAEHAFDEDQNCLICGGYEKTGGVRHLADCEILTIEDWLEE